MWFVPEKKLPPPATVVGTMTFEELALLAATLDAEAEAEAEDVVVTGTLIPATGEVVGFPVEIKPLVLLVPLEVLDEETEAEVADETTALEELWTGLLELCPGLLMPLSGFGPSNPGETGPPVAGSRYQLETGSPRQSPRVVS